MTDWTDENVLDDVTLRLVASENGILEILLHWEKPADGRHNPTHPVLREAACQLRAYFAGDLRQFNLPLDLRGTDFQLRVWNQLLKIPYGETRSYSEIAQAIHSPKAVRAVGAANGANPVSIVVPCHRVIGSSGKLVGYGGGLPLKKRLLELERGSLF
ncbi:MAG TPA: methylated-DNA--[protein]-cysteine S-methyltransferase [Verrucomicrobiae bacterium]|nr:methylated-DNA--[protein]-cysteine S-methyltransferase [Verrucomicrobiae bacterium]